MENIIEEINEFLHLLVLFSEKYYNLCKLLNYHYAENILVLRVCYGLGVLLSTIHDDSIELDEQSHGEVSTKEKVMQSEHFTITQERIAQSIFKFKLEETGLMQHAIKHAANDASLSRKAVNNITSLGTQLCSWKIENILDIPPQLGPAIYYFLRRQESRRCLNRMR